MTIRHRVAAGLVLALPIVLALSHVAALGTERELPEPIHSERTYAFADERGRSVVVYAGDGLSDAAAIERALLTELATRGFAIGRVVPTSTGHRVVAVHRAARVITIVFGVRRDGRASTVFFESPVHGSPQSPPS